MFGTQKWDKLFSANPRKAARPRMLSGYSIVLWSFQISHSFRAYFPFRKQSYPQDINPDHQDINLESCKLACLKIFSCKAAIYNSSSLVGNCYLQSQIFSLRSIVEKEEETYFKVHIKVQNNIPPPGQNNVPPQQQKNQLQIILGSTLASFFSLLLFIGILGFLFWKKENADEAEYSLDLVLGILMVLVKSRNHFWLKLRQLAAFIISTWWD